MTPRAAVAGTGEVEELLAVGRLATAMPLGDAHPDWERTFEVAVRERCAPLAWLRSADAIRRHAPPAVQRRWRSHALCATEHAHGQAAELVALVGAFADAGLSPVVLKGLPLSVMLYGDVAARPSTDTDLFVPAAERAAAHRLLLAAGWRHLYGDAPDEGSYQFDGVARCPYLELHSTVLDENLWAHVRVPVPERRRVTLDTGTVAAQDGRLLPVFLAAHLAKHAAVPLLWWVDFHALWRGLSDGARSDIRALAAECGLHRCLAWAVEGAAALERAASATADHQARDAMQRLRALHHSHNARRVATLAPDAIGRLQVLLAWAWPHHLRRRPFAYAHHALRRAGAVVRRAVAATTRTVAGPALPPDGSVRVLPVDDDAWLEVVRAAVGGGGTIWVRARGSSMLPAVPAGAHVRLGPLPDRPLRPGEVVLADIRAGAPLLHRIVDAEGETYRLKGDARLVPDPLVTHDRLVALADSVRVGDRVRPMPGPPRPGMRRVLSRGLATLRSRARG